MITIFNSIIASFVLIVESIVYIFIGIKPHLYKNYRSQAYKDIMKHYTVPELDLSLEENTLYNRQHLERDWENIGGYFETILGLYPGSPTWNKMASGKIPKTEEFDRMYKRYEEDVTDRILERIKNDPAYK